jgi:hypothetical protein
MSARISHGRPIGSMSKWLVYVELELIGGRSLLGRSNSPTSITLNRDAERIEHAIKSTLKAATAVGRTNSRHLVFVQAEYSLPKLEQAQRELERALRATVTVVNPLLEFRFVALRAHPASYEPLPRLLGVSEVAAALRVTPQRVRQLMTRLDFPQPKEQLRMGPVFLEREIVAFDRLWTRVPGRPARTSTR